MRRSASASDPLRAQVGAQRVGGTIPGTSWELNSSTGASRSPRRTGYQDVDTEDEVEPAQLPAVDKATITDSFDRVVTTRGCGSQSWSPTSTGSPRRALPGRVAAEQLVRDAVGVREPLER